MTELSDERLREIRAYCGAATEGPWTLRECYYTDADGDEWLFWDVDSGAGADYICSRKESNMTFIANARTDLPAVVDELLARRAREEKVEALVEAVKSLLKEQCGFCLTATPNFPNCEETECLTYAVHEALAAMEEDTTHED